MIPKLTVLEPPAELRKPFPRDLNRRAARACRARDRVGLEPGFSQDTLLAGISTKQLKTHSSNTSGSVCDQAMANRRTLRVPDFSTTHRPAVPLYGLSMLPLTPRIAVPNQALIHRHQRLVQTPEARRLRAATISGAGITYVHNKSGDFPFPTRS